MTPFQLLPKLLWAINHVCPEIYMVHLPNGKVVLQHGIWNKVYQLKYVDITSIKSYDSIFDWLINIYQDVKREDLEILFKELTPFPPPYHLYNIFFSTCYRGNSDGISDRVSQIKYHVEILSEKPVPCIDFCPFGVNTAIKIRRPVHTLTNLDSYLHFARCCKGI